METCPGDISVTDHCDVATAVLDIAKYMNPRCISQVPRYLGMYLNAVFPCPNICCKRASEIVACCRSSWNPKKYQFVTPW